MTLSARMHRLRSDATRKHQYNNDDQKYASHADAAVTKSISIVPEAPAEP